MIMRPYIMRRLSLLCAMLLGFLGASAEVKTINIDTKKNVYSFHTTSEGTSSEPTIKKIVSGSFTLTTINSYRTSSNKYLSIKKASGSVSIKPLDDVVIESVQLTTASTVNSGAALTVTVETPDGRSVDIGNLSMSKKSTDVSFDIDENCRMGGTAVTLQATGATVNLSCIKLQYHYNGSRVLNERYVQVTSDDEIKTFTTGDRLLLVACNADGTMVAMGREEIDRNAGTTTHLERNSVPVNAKDGMITITDEPVEVVTLELAPATSEYFTDWYLGVNGRYFEFSESWEDSFRTSSSATTKYRFSHISNSKTGDDEVRITCSIGNTTHEPIKYSTLGRFGRNSGDYIKLFRMVKSPSVAVEVAEAAALQALADGTEVMLASNWSVAYASPDGLTLYLYDAESPRTEHTGHFVKLNLDTPYSGTVGALLPAATVLTVGHEGEDVVLTADAVTTTDSGASLDLDGDLAIVFDTDVNSLAAMPAHQYVTLRNVLINCDGIPGPNQHFEANINNNDPTVPSSAKTFIALRNHFGLSSLPLSGTWEYDICGFIGRPVTSLDIPESHKAKARLEHHDTHYLDRMLYVTDISRHDTTTLVDQLPVDAAASAIEYFNLQGQRVNPSHLAPGIYLMRRGGHVSKLLVK